MKLSEYLTTLNACKVAIDWVGNKTIKQAVVECHRGDWLVWLALEVGIDRQKLTLAKGLCANTVRHLMLDKRSIAAVDAAIAYGEGEINEDELNKAYAATATATAAAYATTAATYAAAIAAAYAATATTTAATYAAIAAADYAATTTAAANAKSKNQQKTAQICREVFGKELIKKVNEHLCQHEYIN